MMVILSPTTHFFFSRQKSTLSEPVCATTYGLFPAIAHSSAVAHSSAIPNTTLELASPSPPLHN